MGVGFYVGDRCFWLGPCGRLGDFRASMANVFGWTLYEHFRRALSVVFIEDERVFTEAEEAVRLSDGTYWDRVNAQADTIFADLPGWRDFWVKRRWDVDACKRVKAVFDAAKARADRLPEPGAVFYIVLTEAINNETPITCC